MGRIAYCIAKRYRGPFKKKHDGNEHFLIVTRPHDEALMVYQIIGNVRNIGDKDKDGYAALNIISGGHNLTDLIDTMKEAIGRDNIIILDEVNSNNKLGRVNDSININIKSSGKYIKGNIYIQNLDNLLDREISINGNKPVYIIRGKLIIETEDIKLNNIKMIAKKKLSISKSMFKNMKLN